MRRGRFRIVGRVQGVGFRYSACAEARRLGLRGWVSNLPDGSVETECEGDDNSVRAYLDWCRQGPSMARVTDVKVDYGEPTGEFDGFQIA